MMSRFMAQLYNKCSKLLGSDSGKDKKDDGEENDGKEDDSRFDDDITSGCPPSQCFLLPCRSVRVGNYKVLPKDRISLSPKGIQIKVPGIFNIEEVSTITILKTDLIRIQAHFGKQMPLLFLYVNSSACLRARKTLKMTSRESFYLDVKSEDETQKRITILPEKLTEENKTALKINFGDYIEDLESKDANEILVRSSPKENSSLRSKLGLLSGSPGNGNPGSDKKDSSVTVKYCQFPPEGAGNVSVTNEDYACLEVEQFLNDVIIDFYLKYLQYGKFESLEQVKEKTHIFTTYFYKRLTTRPTTKNKLRQHPIEDNPNLTPAEKRYDRVRKWTKKVNLFEKDFIVVPINEHAHWFVCVICFPGQMGCVRVEDGQPCEPPASQTSRVKKKKPKKKQITIGSTTIIPIKGRDQDIRLTFDDDSDRDEAEASEDDMEDEPEDGEDRKREDEHNSPGNAGPGNVSANASGNAMAAGQGSKQTTPPPQGQNDTVVGASSDTAGDNGGAWQHTNTAGGSMAGGSGGAVGGIKQPCILIFDSLAGGSKARTCQTLREYLSCEWKERMVGQEGREARVFDSKSMPGNSPKVQQQPNFSDCGIYLLQYVESFFKAPIQDYSLPIRTLRSWFPEDEVRNKRQRIAQLIRQLAASQNAGKEFRFPEIMFHCEMDDDTEEDQDDSNSNSAKPVKITSANGTTMVRLTGTGNNYTTTTTNLVNFVRKKGNQVRVTPMTTLPVGVTVTPAGPSSSVKLSQPGVKIISSASLANSLQVVNRKVPLVSSSSEEGGLGPPLGDSPPVQTSPDSTSQGNEQVEEMDIDMDHRGAPAIESPGAGSGNGSNTAATSSSCNIITTNNLSNSMNSMPTITTNGVPNSHTPHHNHNSYHNEQPDSSIVREISNATTHNTTTTPSNTNGSGGSMAVLGSGSAPPAVAGIVGISTVGGNNTHQYQNMNNHHQQVIHHHQHTLAGQAPSVSAEGVVTTAAGIGAGQSAEQMNKRRNEEMLAASKRMRAAEGESPE